MYNVLTSLIISLEASSGVGSGNYGEEERINVSSGISKEGLEIDASVSFKVESWELNTSLSEIISWSTILILVRSL